jgi:XTP/dITP diphosphohydrolase
VQKYNFFLIPPNFLVVSEFLFTFAAIMEHMHTREEKMEAFGRLLDVMDRLREECPWDRKQTNDSLRPNTIEETYELCDALIRDDQKEICKELGDVLLHVVFYGRIGEEKQQFDIADVCNKLCDKLIFRHPHVYGEAVAKDAESVLESWEQIKLKEKDGNKMVLSGVPAALPSLIKAYRVQDKARNVGFDWEDKQDVWKKVREELNELEVELLKEDKERSTEELGDFLFSVINAARLYKLNPDNALELTNQKFIRRFNYIEQHSIRAGKPLKDMTLEEMDQLWNEAKEQEKENNK